MYIVNWEFNAGNVRKLRGMTIEDKEAETYPNYRALLAGDYLRVLPENEPANPKKATKKSV
jgi:hypothetical protein